MTDQLSASAREYLNMIYVLGKGGGVRCVDVAKEMNVSKPSVNKAIHLLSQQGYLVQERYALIYLTRKGLRAAEEICKQEEIIRGLLEDVFNVDATCSMEDAKQIAAVIGQETFEKMRMYLNNFHYNN